MSELKIMTHLGPHLNIVNLLGACTKSGRHTLDARNDGLAHPPVGGTPSNARINLDQNKVHKPRLWVGCGNRLFMGKRRLALLTVLLVFMSW